MTGTSNNPVIYKDDYDFKIGEAIKLKEGNDITIFATGRMVYNSLKASEILNEKKISAKVVNIHTIKPIDKKSIEDANKTKMIFTVEEHNIIGGLGSAVAEHQSSLKNSVRLIRIGFTR